MFTQLSGVTLTTRMNTEAGQSGVLLYGAIKALILHSV